jgi:hypothetical protein
LQHLFVAQPEGAHDDGPGRLEQFAFDDGRKRILRLIHIRDRSGRASSSA